MKHIRWLFGALMLSLLLVEFSFWGLISTHRNTYTAALVISTAAMVYIGYSIYLAGLVKKTEIQKEFSFFLIENHTGLEEEDILFRQIKKRL